MSDLKKEFQPFNHYSQIAAGTTTQTISSDLSFIIHSTFSLNFWVFTPLFHSPSSKFTTSKFITTTAQFQFYNCNYILQLQELSSAAR